MRVLSPIETQKWLHFGVVNVGLRAQATAVGLVQLCVELRDANVLSEQALDRIKDAIADEVAVAAPRRWGIQEYRHDIRNRLDQLFGGEKKVGSAEALSFGNDLTG